MFNKLRKRFVLIAMAVILCLEILLMGTLIGITIAQNYRSGQQILDALIEYEGVIPNSDFWSQRWGEEGEYRTRYFTVRADSNSKLVAVDTRNIAAISANDAWKIAKNHLWQGKMSGLSGRYLFRGVKDRNTGMILLVYLDIEPEINQVKNLLFISTSISLVFSTLSFILIASFSKKAIRPFVENDLQQKQFINDAGHDLKTPLSIIQANVDVMELSGEKTEWTESIRRQTQRMTQLIERLLRLNRYEEGTVTSKVNISTSDAILTVLSEYKPAFELKQLTIGLDLPKDMYIWADPRQFADLLHILFDNVRKYAVSGGSVHIGVEENKDSWRISISNPSEDISPEDCQKIFRRFYRLDYSRQNNEKVEGNGLGLPVTKSIMANHGGTVTASCLKHVFTIVCYFPKNKD